MIYVSKEGFQEQQKSDHIGLFQKTQRNRRMQELKVADILSGKRLDDGDQNSVG